MIQYVPHNQVPSFLSDLEQKARAHGFTEWHNRKTERGDKNTVHKALQKASNQPTPRVMKLVDGDVKKLLGYGSKLSPTSDLYINTIPAVSDLFRILCEMDKLNLKEVSTQKEAVFFGLGVVYSLSNVKQQAITYLHKAVLYNRDWSLLPAIPVLVLDGLYNHAADTFSRFEGEQDKHFFNKTRALILYALLLCENKERIVAEILEEKPDEPKHWARCAGLREDRVLLDVYSKLQPLEDTLKEMPFGWIEEFISSSLENALNSYENE